jgi:hypothetical protein
MKKLLLLLLLIPALYAGAQDSWKVRLNNKIIVAATEINETAHTKMISPSLWKKNGQLEVVYKSPEPLEEGWVRTIYFIDESGNELIVKDNTSKVRISQKQLRKTFAGKKKINIYTVGRPLDPEVAMRVRLRRVHLCTLELP